MSPVCFFFKLDFKFFSSLFFGCPICIQWSQPCRKLFCFSLKKIEFLVGRNSSLVFDGVYFRLIGYSFCFKSLSQSEVLFFQFLNSSFMYLMIFSISSFESCSVSFRTSIRIGHLNPKRARSYPYRAIPSPWRRRVRSWNFGKFIRRWRK